MISHTGLCRYLPTRVTRAAKTLCWSQIGISRI